MGAMNRLVGRAHAGAVALIGLGASGCEATMSAPPTRAHAWASSRASAALRALPHAGPLENERAVAVIRTHVGALRRCYERGLEIDAALLGRVEVQFTIAGEGRAVNVVAIGLSSVPSVGACMAAAFEAMRFPRPEGGAVAYAFPFVFLPE